MCIILIPDIKLKDTLSKTRSVYYSVHKHLKVRRYSFQVEYFTIF